MDLCVVLKCFLWLCVCVKWLLTHMENSLKLVWNSFKDPNKSSGEVHATPLYSCNASHCHFMTALSLKVCVCLCAWVCTYMHMDGSGSDVIDETWKRADHDFQSISSVNNHPGCGLKAESCLNKQRLTSITFRAQLFCSLEQLWQQN